MQHSINPHNVTVLKSLLLIPTLFFLMPSLPIANGQYITYPFLMAVVVLMVILTKGVTKIEVDNKLFIIFYSRNSSRYLSRMDIPSADIVFSGYCNSLDTIK